MQHLVEQGAPLQRLRWGGHCQAHTARQTPLKCQFADSVL